MNILNILIIIVLFHFSLLESYQENWRNYPTCKIGRMQSPIEIKEYESIYANNFSFVYQSYKGSNLKLESNKYAYIKTIDDNGGYINFERGGVIKQYQFIRAEIYPGLHKIDEKIADYELHLIHEKNLDFITNKNQYRSIQDANMYLVIVLRYSSCTGDKVPCISDNGLLEKLKSVEEDESNQINLNDYKIFQDKRAYFYEGSFVHIPCDENVNYYVVKDFFFLNGNIEEVDNLLTSDDIKSANRFGRPVYKNFMNYREVLGIDYFSFKLIFISFLLMIELL
jgi:carbonic anhydrase